MRVKGASGQTSSDIDKVIVVKVYRNGYTGPYKLCHEAHQLLKGNTYGNYSEGRSGEGYDAYVYHLSSFVTGDVYVKFYIENTDVYKYIWGRVLSKEEVSLDDIELEPSTQKLELDSEPQIIDIAVNRNGYEGGFSLLCECDTSMVSTEFLDWNDTWTSVKLRVVPLKCGESKLRIYVEDTNIFKSVGVSVSMD